MIKKRYKGLTLTAKYGIFVTARAIVAQSMSGTWKWQKSFQNERQTVISELYYLRPVESVSGGHQLTYTVTEMNRHRSGCTAHKRKMRQSSRVKASENRSRGYA